jgi:hypothetical protein
MNTVRLKPEIEDKMRILANRLGVTVSDIHRTAIEQYLNHEFKSNPLNHSDGKPALSIWDKVIGVVGEKKDVKEQTEQGSSEPARKKRTRNSG